MNKPLKHRWYPILRSTTLKENKIHPIQFDSKHYILYKNSENKIYMHNRWCPHRGADMMSGVIKSCNNSIACPYHGWEFDNETGCVRYIPSSSLCFPYDDNNINIGEHFIHDDSFLLWFYYGDEQSCPIDSPPNLWTDIQHDKTVGTKVINTNWLNVIENAIDPSHPNFVHDKSFSDGESSTIRFVEYPKYDMWTDRITAICLVNHNSNNSIIRLLNTFLEKKLHTVNTISIYFTLLFPNVIKIKFTNNSTTIVTILFICPNHENKTTVFWCLTHDYCTIPSHLKFLSDLFVTRSMDDVFEEDIHILENLNPHARSMNPINVDADKIQVLFRHIYHDKFKRL